MAKASPFVVFVFLSALARSATAQLPSGYHLAPVATLPDSLSESLDSGRFQVSVRRSVRSARDAQLLSIAERLYPTPEAIVAGATSKRERERIIMDSLGVDTTGWWRNARRPGDPRRRWWTYSFDGTWIPFAITGQSVEYYLARIRDHANSQQKPRPGVQPTHGAFKYNAWVEPADGGGAVVRMRLSWSYWCGVLCALDFSAERSVWFDSNGDVIKVEGDRQPDVMVS